MSRLVQAYISGDPRLADALGAPPQRLFDAAPPQPAMWNADLVTALRRHQTRLGLTRTLTGDEVVVITGQQPGLLGGPLYTVYKALTAVALARELSERYGCKAVPLFWNASEDHDFEEVRTANILSRQGEPVALTYTPEADVAGAPMHRVPVEPSLHALIDQAAALAFGSDDADAIRAFLHTSLDASDSLADWFSRIMARLFRDTPLVLFAPHWPEARQAAASILRRVLDDPLAATRIVNEAGERLTERGFGAQVIKSDDECPFFLDVGGRRRKVLWRDDGFRLPEEKLRFSRDEMAAVLASEPERFSPNVTLRPIVQQTLFPATAAYVAGPGEIAYWAQLRGVFDWLDTPMPVVYPRASAVLTTPKLRRRMQEFGLSLPDLSTAESTLFERLLPTLPPDAPRRALADRREPVARALAELRAALAAADSEAWPADRIRRMEARIERDFDRLDRALARRDERAADQLRARIRRLTGTLAPWRKPQERVYTVFSFLFGQGWGLVDRIAHGLDVHQFHMNEIDL